MLYLLFDQLRGWLDSVGVYGALAILDQIEFRALAAAGLAFVIVLSCGRRVIAWLARMKIGDSGLTDAEALSRVSATKANTPTMGGLLIVGAMLGSTLLLGDVTVRWVQLAVVVVGWLACVGAADDWLKLTAARRGAGSRQGLHAWEKLVFQLGLGLIIGFFAYRAGLGESPVETAHVLNLPFQKTYLTPSRALNPDLWVLALPVYVVVATLLITGLSNAVNLTDGMDGLASGITVIVGLGLLVVSLIAGKQGWAQTLLVPYVGGAGELAVVAGSMVGACLGFLWFNASPAQVFMGDTGSLPLGGLIAYVAIVTRQEFVVLAMSGVFLLEMASVMLQVGYFKVSGGNRVFRCAPYHHHLHLGGWRETQVVTRAWIVTILLVVVALASVKVR